MSGCTLEIVEQHGAAAACGNGIVERAAGEVCDDGNVVDGDGCSADCRSNERCGNAIVDLAIGETCDDGNTVDGDGCDRNCTVSRCGNLVVDPGEQCDDGNLHDGDFCERDCTVPRCGNLIVDPGEACDDGNAINGDGCDLNCTITACGNGIATIDEACDDGNLADGDLCEHDCTRPGCGNGILDSGEDCDDGNTVNGDGCDADCTIPGSLTKYDIAYVSDLTVSATDFDVGELIVVVNKGLNTLALSTTVVVEFFDDDAGAQWVFEQTFARPSVALAPGHAAGALSPVATQLIIGDGLVTEPRDDLTLDFGMHCSNTPAVNFDLHAQATIRIDDKAIVLPFVIHYVVGGSPRLNRARRIGTP